MNVSETVDRKRNYTNDYSIPDTEIESPAKRNKVFYDFESTMFMVLAIIREQSSQVTILLSTLKVVSREFQRAVLELESRPFLTKYEQELRNEIMIPVPYKNEPFPEASPYLCDSLFLNGPCKCKLAIEWILESCRRSTLSVLYFAIGSSCFPCCSALWKELSNLKSSWIYCCSDDVSLLKYFHAMSKFNLSLETFYYFDWRCQDLRAISFHASKCPGLKYFKLFYFHPALGRSDMYHYDIQDAPRDLYIEYTPIEPNEDTHTTADLEQEITSLFKKTEIWNQIKQLSSERSCKVWIDSIQMWERMKELLDEQFSDVSFLLQLNNKSGRNGFYNHHLVNSSRKLTFVHFPFYEEGEHFDCLFIFKTLNRVGNFDYWLPVSTCLFDNQPPKHKLPRLYVCESVGTFKEYFYNLMNPDDQLIPWSNGTTSLKLCFDSSGPRVRYAESNFNSSLEAKSII